MNHILVGTLATLGYLALIPITTIWRGYVLSILWGWFAVPTFGLPALAIPAAIGVSMIVSFLTYQAPKDEPETWKAIAVATVGPAFALLFGWIVTWWMP